MQPITDTEFRIERVSASTPEQPEWRLPGTDPIGSRRIRHGRYYRYLVIQHQPSRGLIPNTRARYHKLRQYWHKMRRHSDHNKSSVT